MNLLRVVRRPQVPNVVHRTALVVAVAYVSLSTDDLSIGPAPLKFLVTLAALGLWLAAGPSLRANPWALPTATFGLGVPAFGLLVATIGQLTDSPAQPLGLSAAFTEASRFVYVLLALPLIDWYRDAPDARRADRIWLWPAGAVAAISCVIYGMHVAGVAFTGSGGFGPFAGDIGVDLASGRFRVFTITAVVLIPALTLIYTRISQGKARAGDFALGALLASAVYLAHTRGIWVGVVIGCGVSLLLKVALEVERARRPLVALGALGLAVAVVGLSVPSLASPVVDSVTAGSAEESANSRIVQAPELLEGARAYPLAGAGLGGVLPSGYVRSTATPWSYELAYLQLLFQLGIAGLLALAWLPSRALRRGVRRTFTVTGAPPVGTIAGVSALCGLLVACASNPYLVTSVGTMLVGVGIALAAGPQEREEPALARAGDEGE